MNAAARALALVLDLNTRLLINCLSGVDDDTARRRPGDRTNSMAFLALHLLDSRCFMAGYLGQPVANPFADLLEGKRGIDEMHDVAPVDAMRAAWTDVSAAVAAAVRGLADEAAEAPSPQRFPVDDSTILGGLAFLVQHDSYHVGQLALLRKHWGLEAMSYR